MPKWFPRKEVRSRLGQQILDENTTHNSQLKCPQINFESKATLLAVSTLDEASKTLATPEPILSVCGASRLYCYPVKLLIHSLRLLIQLMLELQRSECVCSWGLSKRLAKTSSLAACQANTVLMSRRMKSLTDRSKQVDKRPRVFVEDLLLVLLNSNLLWWMQFYHL